jgi:DNA-binding response OmpR family regulator
LRKAVNSTVDVVLCNIEIPPTDFCVITQDIRHGRIGGNPFTVLMAMTGPVTESDVARFLKSGVDDLIFKPMEPDAVISRIGAFSRRRNPFIVTPAYIGPTRRAERRADGSDDDSMIEVPNTLKAKAAQSSRAADVQALVQSAVNGLNEKKAQSGLRVVCRLARRLHQLHPQPGQAEEIVRIVRTLAGKADELTLEHRNSATTRHVAAIGERIARLARRGESLPIPVPPSTVEVNLLLQLSDAALAAFLNTGTGKGAGVVPEIVAVVEEYLARN